MDKTRVFVSSTCYDLEQIRRDLEDFIGIMGYQPVLSDSKDISIPPGLDNIQVCKWLVTCSHIFVLIIGGRFGSEDRETGKSITNIEYDTAYELGMPIYTFVDQEVDIKRETYRRLKEMVRVGELQEGKIKDALGGKIEDVRIFEFIDRVSTAQRDQWYRTFSQSSQIIENLKNNWSLLFKELLSEKRAASGLTQSLKFMPKLSLRWRDGVEEGTEILYVGAIPDLDKDEVIKQLEEIKPNPQLLNLIQEKAKDIEDLILQRRATQLGLSKEPKDIPEFIKSASHFAHKIDKLLKMIESNFNDFRKYHDLIERSINPKFAICNHGTTPAENITIYLVPSEKVMFFLEKIEVEVISIFLPRAIPPEVSELIQLAQNLESFKRDLTPVVKEALKKDDFFSQFFPKDQLPVGLLNRPDLFDLPPTLPQVKSPWSIQLEKGSLRIDLDKLSHNFIWNVHRDYMYLCPFLEKGETETLEYSCFADNLPEPSRGKLTLIAE